MLVAALIGVIGALSGCMIFCNLYWKRKIGEKARLIKETEAQIIHMEKMASLGTLAAGIAHEINNPLSYLISDLETLRDYFKSSSPQAAVAGQAFAGASGEEIQEMISESLVGAWRIKRIVSDLKLFSRREEPQLAQVDVNQILDSLLAIVWHEAKNRITFHKDYQAKTSISAEPNQLSQVFLNILINAIQAIADKGVIRMITYEDAQSIYVKISDSGCGIPQDVQAKIFDPFFSTKKSTGLGLSVSYTIIKKHKGDISVESSPGAGAAFVVRLPKN